MTHLTKTRRHIVAALCIAAILAIAPASSSGAAIPRAGRSSQVPASVCNYDWRKGTFQIRQLIVCAANRWPVPGGAAAALAIADRESNFQPGAYNPAGSAGIYQHLLRYWPGRAASYGFAGWSAFNARANIIVTMRMVNQGGWGPWGG